MLARHRQGQHSRSLANPPITIIADVTTIVSKVFRISKDVSDLVDAIENAPKHILAVSQDVRSLCGVLGPLQGLLQDPKLKSCLRMWFRYSKACKSRCIIVWDIRRSKWAWFWWQFKEKEANAYRAHLTSYKLTVDVALAAENLANTSQTIQVTHMLELEIRNTRAQLDGMENNGASGQCQSVEAGNGP
ncbi:hypothetical protein B0O99DRAFT_693593 [Bisporella sp. PMI_857]|nr:hypothetical protein B0O99DRAFT_693593 [Bisporella sp. PMI_857]